MARQFVNPFTPRSDIGQGVSNIMTALFAGAGSGANAGNVALSEQRLASAAYDEARKNEILDRMIGVRDLSENIAKAYRDAQATRTPELALSLAQGDDGLGLQVDEEMRRNLFSEAAGPAGTSMLPAASRRTMSSEQLARLPGAQTFGLGEQAALPLGMTYGEGALDAPMPDMLPTPNVQQAILDIVNEESNRPIPGIGLRLPGEQAPRFPDIEVGQGPLGPVSPDAAFMMNAQIAEALARASGTVTPQGLADAIGKLQAQEAERALLAGEITPTQYFQLLGKQVTGISGGVQYNQADPTQPLVVTPPGQAQIDLRGAQQGLAEERKRFVEPLAESLIESRKRGTPLLNINIGPDGSVTTAPAPTGAVDTDVVGSLGTGGTGFFGNLANFVSDALGFGTPFPNVDKAINALQNIHTQTVTTMMVAIAGRESVKLMEKLEPLAVNPASIRQGDARSLQRLKQTRDMLNAEVTRMKTQILDRPQAYTTSTGTLNKAYLDTLNNHSQLQMLMNAYDTLISNWGATSWGQQSPAAGVQSEWTEADERRLRELEEKARAPQ